MLYAVAWPTETIKTTVGTRILSDMLSVWAVNDAPGDRAKTSRAAVCETPQPPNGGIDRVLESCHDVLFILGGKSAPSDEKGALGALLPPKNTQISP